MLKLGPQERRAVGRLHDRHADTPVSTAYSHPNSTWVESRNTKASETLAAAVLVERHRLVLGCQGGERRTAATPAIACPRAAVIAAICSNRPDCHRDRRRDDRR